MSPNTENSNKNSFSLREKHSAAIRIWHWLLFLVVLSLLVTVLVNGTVLHRDSTIPAITKSLQKNGVSINPEQARKVAGSIRHIVWELHGYIGLALAALLVYRMVLEFFEHSDQKLQARIRKGLAMLKNNLVPKADSKNYVFAKFSYLVFYILLIVIVSTGLLLFFHKDLGIGEDTEHLIKEIHEYDMYFILAFILVHIAGIIKSELGRGKGAVSDMINGG